ncbi:hypothetical protein P9112_000245 [Eukaryota sp. TZLM1-RC]
MIHRSTFESLCQPMFDQCMTLVAELLKRRGLTSNDVAQVLLVGLFTRISKIRQMLTDSFGIEKVKGDLKLDEVVARGASLAVNNAEANEKVVLYHITARPLRTDFLRQSKLMGLSCDDNSLISALCSTISNVLLNLAEWNCDKFVDQVCHPIMTAAELIAKHSVILKPLGSVITDVLSVLKQVKYNRFQSVVLAARLLRLTKATFSPLEKLPDLSNSPAIRDTIDNFVTLTNKITTYLNQYNDSKWYRKVFSRERFKRDFEQHNKLLDDFSSELNLEFSGIALEKLSTVSFSKIEGIITRDEEVFKFALATYNQSILDQISEQYSDLVQEMQATIQTTLREEIKTQSMSCLKEKEEKQAEIIQLQSCADNVEIDIDNDDLVVDWKSKIHSGQAEVVFAEYGLANVAMKFFKDDEYISADLAREYRILNSLPNVPSVPRVYGIARVYEKGDVRIGLVMEKLSTFTQR